MSGPGDISFSAPPGLIHSLSARFGTEVAQTFHSLLDQGLSVGEALSQTLNFDNRSQSNVDSRALAQVFDSLPHEVQQRIVQGADALPPPVREALDQLGITQPQQRQGDDAAALHANRGGSGSDGGPANATGQAFGVTNAHGTKASAQVGNTFAAQQASPQAAAFSNQQVAQAPLADRAFNDIALPQQGGRATEGFAAARVQDPGNAVFMADRINAAQQQMQSQSLPLAQGRPDALAAQVTPALAGATMLASPQGPALPSQVTAPAPPGTDAAAAQARDSQLAPAGHTLAGTLRRDLRKGMTPLHERPIAWALALLPGRRKARQGDEDQPTSFHWLFWILTIVAYGALAIAVIAMIPGGGSLTDGYGAPTYGAYALIVGAIAAVASWLIGRRLSQR